MDDRVLFCRWCAVAPWLAFLAMLVLAGSAQAQGDPIGPPVQNDDYYVPPGYSDAPPPPAQPYPAPQTQPYPAQTQPYPAQPYPAQQPYAQQAYVPPGQVPYRGRRRLERLGRSEAAPAGVEVIERRRLVLAFVGVGVFVGSYALPLAVMVDSGADSRRTAIPVLGILLENAHSDYLLGGSWGLAVLDAGVHALGLTLFALGMRPQRYAVFYVDTGRGRTLALSPGVSPGGLSFDMRF